MYFLSTHLFILEGLFIATLIGLLPFYYNDIYTYFICFSGYCLTIISFIIRFLFKPFYLKHVNNIIFCVGYSAGLFFFMSDGYVFRYISIINLIKLHFYYSLFMFFAIKAVYNLIGCKTKTFTAQSSITKTYK